jgi:hypothetical protein
MKLITPRSGMSGIAPAKIPVIVLLLIIVQICGNGNTLYAQTDSLALTSVPLTEIASAAARNMQQMRDLLVKEVQVSTSYNLIPQIDSLENRVTELEELSDQIMLTRLEYAYYNSLIMRWQRIKSMSNPIQETLLKYLADVEELNTKLERALSKWDLTLMETDQALLTEDVVSRITGISHNIDSVHQILNDSLTSSLALQNRITDIDLVIETYLHDIAELQKVELGKSLLTRDESIFNLKKRSDSLYIERARSQSLFSRHQRQGV